MLELYSATSLYSLEIVKIIFLLRILTNKFPSELIYSSETDLGSQTIVTSLSLVVNCCQPELSNENNLK